MRKPLVTFSLLCACALLGPQGAPGDANDAPVFHVHPEGRDTWSGRLDAPAPDGADGPLASLQAAVDAARQVGGDQPRAIHLAPGEYFLPHPVALDHRDSGLTVRGAGADQTILIGGRVIGGWRDDGDGRWSAPVEGVREGDWDFRALIVNDRYCPRARLPRDGFFEHESVFDVRWMSSTGGGWQRPPTDVERTTLRYRDGDLGDWLDVNNAELTVYHMWDSSMVGVAAIDAATRTVTFSNPAGHPAGAFGVKKYEVWNVAEGLTDPGQWFLDRTLGRVVYRPLEGEDMTRARAIAPTMESLLILGGEGDRPIRDLTITDLGLTVSDTALQAGGFGALAYPGALEGRRVLDSRIARLRVWNVAGQGIRLNQADGTTVARCEVWSAGAGGVAMGGRQAVVEDCHIHHIGRTYPSAIGLRGSGEGLRLSHNTVHNTPYSAINSGGKDQIIEGNLLYAAMEQLHDGAGIYMFAADGTIVRNNLIRDIVDTGGYGASAYYLDERSKDCVVENNVSIRVVCPLHCHMTEANTIRNNAFFTDGDMELRFARCEGLRLENNILAAPGRIFIQNTAALAALEGNVLFSARGEVEGAPMRDYALQETTAIAPGDGANTLLPPWPLGGGAGLSMPEDGVIAIPEGSEAARLGIAPIDASQAGVRKE